MNKEKVLDFDVCVENSDELLTQIFIEYAQNKQSVIINVNPEIIINNYKDENFVKEFNEQKFQIPDGIGIVYASKIKKGNIKSRITGIDFMEQICKKSIQYNSKIFLYGAKPGVADKAKSELEKKYQGINIVGSCDGYINIEEAIEEINRSNADILFVGLGCPRQENFIIENKEKLKKVLIFMPVGGSFDVISNTLKRAPQWMQKCNLEWLYRLIKQPSRIFRQIKLLEFIFIIIRDKKSK